MIPIWVTVLLILASFFIGWKVGYKDRYKGIEEAIELMEGKSGNKTKEEKELSKKS